MWFIFITARLFSSLRFQPRLAATLWRSCPVVNSPTRRMGLAPMFRSASLAQTLRPSVKKFVFIREIRVTPLAFLRALLLRHSSVSLTISLSSDLRFAKLMPMKNPPQKKNVTMQPFQSGQIWQMENSHVRIGDVGKTLVHYKVLKGEVKRGPIRLSGKPDLQNFLRVHRAILVQ